MGHDLILKIEGRAGNTFFNYLSDVINHILVKIFDILIYVINSNISFITSLNAGDNDYLSFGRSGNDDSAAMIGADVAVVYYDSDSKQARVEDYYLSAKSQVNINYV